MARHACFRWKPHASLHSSESRLPPPQVHMAHRSAMRKLLARLRNKSVAASTIALAQLRPAELTRLAGGGASLSARCSHVVAGEANVSDDAPDADDSWCLRPGCLQEPAVRTPGGACTACHLSVAEYGVSLAWRGLRRNV